MTAARHRWLLTAPWYRWPSHDPAAVRASAPALQAFALPTFIAEFLREPQRSLTDRPDDHFWFGHGVRRLFRPEHHRFYIVACELHCDVAGLPPVTRDRVCEAGFQILEAGADPPHTPAADHHRLYPLVPPPDAPKHSARGRSLFFGAVPAAGGTPESILEIRCFVRRHRTGCPRKSTTPDCHGEVVWSNPSEKFRVAAPDDLVGIRHDPALATFALQRDDLPANVLRAFNITELGDTTREALAKASKAKPEIFEYHQPKAPPA